LAVSLRQALGGAKLSPPRLGPTDLEREKLIELLRSHRGLCLMVAPPGFGKTTLLAQWERADERPFAWLTLDPGDNDPVVLWTNLTSAVGSLVNGGGGGNGSRKFTTTWLGRRPRLDVRKAIQRVSAELAAFESDVVLVLDDCHTITEPECLTTLRTFLDLQPPNATISLSARSDPAVPIGARRVRTDVIELRAADLGFTVDECERLLNGALGLSLSPSAITVLWDRTEGWPAGLHLAYLSLRDAFDREALVAQFRGVSRHVVDYLTEVVIESQDERVRDFLLRTSILDRMSGPLCDFVLETDGSAELLEESERGSLFVVALDDRREWYRYHRLFVELLREELQRRHPELVPGLHRRASRWLVEHAEITDAIRHAIAAEDVEAATVFVSENYLRTLEWGGSSTIGQWLKMFPRSAIVADARLSVVEAWVKNFHGRYAEADVAMGNALRAGHHRPLPDGAGSVEASAALLRASAPRDDVTEMLTAARRAYELEGAGPSMWRVTTHVQLGWALLLSGAPREAQPLLERAAVEAPMTEQWLNAFGARALLAWAGLREGRLSDAEGWALDAVDVIEANALPGPYSDWAYATLGAVRANAGWIDEADELLTASVDAMRGAAASPVQLFDGLLALAQVRRAQGSSPEARALLDEARAIVTPFEDPGILADELERAMRSPALRQRDTRTDVSLTERELEVLRLLEKGFSKREVARALFVSYNTIHTHTKSIYRKLGALTRPEAIQNARERGVL
jgi:LuxR family transcriptional regulator, maltose regulon positive regulatory protein